MAKNKVQRGTFLVSEPVEIVGAHAVVGQTEAAGPYGGYFGTIVEDEMYGEDSFEKAERKFFEQAVWGALGDSGDKPDNIDCLIGGDLLNQIISAGYGARELSLPFLGIYGACSTMAEGLLLSSVLIGGGFADKTACATASSFAAAERQFRMPLELGTPSPPTAQHTVTGGASCVVAKGTGNGYGKIIAATIGTVIDVGIDDASNMGAAMAGAALQTISDHLDAMKLAPDAYDAIITGDLGTLGSELLVDLGQKYGLDISGVHKDCGAMIFEGLPDMNCGGSGCACGGSMLTSYFLKELREKHMKRILFVATGALLSPTAIAQGESIPSVAHAVDIVGV